jgi:hypothetical protein
MDPETSDTARAVVPYSPFSDRPGRIEAAAIYVAGALDGMACAPGDDVSRVALIGLATALRRAVNDE